MENNVTTPTMRTTAQLAEYCDSLVREWAGNEYAIHKRPPFKAHTFDTKDRFWVVGSTRVSVFYCGGSRANAERVADALNNAWAAAMGIDPSMIGGA